MRLAAAVAAIITVSTWLLPATAFAQGSSGGPTLSIPDSEKVQVFRFEQSREPKTGGFTLDVNGATDPGNPPIPRASVRGDMISEGGDRIPRAQVTVTRIAANGTGGLDVDVRVDPKGAPPGSYSTVIQFGQGGYATTLPITIQARLRAGWLLALALAMLGWVVGSALKVLSDLFGTATVDVSAGDKRNFRAWLQKGGWPMLAGGFVGALIAWGIAYLPSDTWGASPTEWLTLVGTALGASVAGSTVGDLARGLGRAA